MDSCHYSFSELKINLEEIERIETRIEFISQRIVEANQFILEIRQALADAKIEGILISTDQPKYQQLFNELLANDIELRNAIAKGNICLVSKKLCESTVIFIEQAKILMKHYARSLKIQVQAKAIRESIATAERLFPAIQSIIWKESESNLLKLFRVLHSNEVMPSYTRVEILTHFTNAKLKPFINEQKTITRFIWQDSDSNFAVFVNELANLGVINDENKYKNVSAHFLNRNGELMKNLAQKKNYKDLSLDAGSLIREILSFLKDAGGTQ